MKSTDDKTGGAKEAPPRTGSAVRGRTSFCVRLAGITIGVHAMYPETETFFRDYLTGGGFSSFDVSVTPRDLAFEQEQTELLCALEGREQKLHTGRYLETLAVCRGVSERMIDYDVLLFHGSAVAVDGEAYLFGAPSGTGKSTHARLWRRLFGQRAVMINDDKPFLKCAENEIIVYGNPWDGKHHLSANTSAPLKAVCILKQDAVNHIEAVSARGILPDLLMQCYRPDDPGRVEKSLELIGRICSHAQLYRLGCNTDPAAAAVAYEGMRKGRKGRKGEK